MTHLLDTDICSAHMRRRRFGPSVHPVRRRHHFERFWRSCTPELTNARQRLDCCAHCRLASGCRGPRFDLPAPSNLKVRGDLLNAASTSPAPTLDRLSARPQSHSRQPQHRRFPEHPRPRWTTGSFRERRIGSPLSSPVGERGSDDRSRSCRVEGGGRSAKDNFLMRRRRSCSASTTARCWCSASRRAGLDRPHRHHFRQASGEHRAWPSAGGARRRAVAVLNLTTGPATKPAPEVQAHPQIHSLTVGERRRRAKCRRGLGDQWLIAVCPASTTTSSSPARCAAAPIFGAACSRGASLPSLFGCQSSSSLWFAVMATLLLSVQ